MLVLKSMIQTVMVRAEGAFGKAFFLAEGRSVSRVFKVRADYEVGLSEFLGFVDC